MAEPFGIVSGAVGIATAFNACVDCFKYVKLGRLFGRDFQTSQLSLSCVRLRLSRWGKAVHIFDDPYLGNPNATPEELQNAKRTLLHILCLFEDTATISHKYRLRAKSSDDLSEFLPGDLDATSAALDNKMRDLAVQRQKGASILKTTQWALYEGSEFKRLIESITLLIGNLETLFPARPQQASLMDQELKEIHDKQHLKLLAATAQGVDETLRRAADEALTTGHRYRNIQIRGKTRIHLGDAFGADWQGGAVGKNLTFDGMVIDSEAKVFGGNKYGGKDFCDD
jgi:hypothetical protein